MGRLSTPSVIDGSSAAPCKDRSDSAAAYHAGGGGGAGGADGGGAEGGIGHARIDSEKSLPVPDPNLRTVSWKGVRGVRPSNADLIALARAPTLWSVLIPAEKTIGGTL
eukprot:7377510-Prymnesium_polylepis.1